MEDDLVQQNDRLWPLRQRCLIRHHPEGRRIVDFMPREMVLASFSFPSGLLTPCPSVLHVIPSCNYLSSHDLPPSQHINDPDNSSSVSPDIS
jgi:hypothetical protein